MQHSFDRHKPSWNLDALNTVQHCLFTHNGKFSYVLEILHNNVVVFEAIVGTFSMAKGDVQVVHKVVGCKGSSLQWVYCQNAFVPWLFDTYHCSWFAEISATSEHLHPNILAKGLLARSFSYR